ncbi:FAD-dependent oxidoreductase [Porticoccus sp. W117]|uniref:glycerol-3-phosphate dehydrogenase/oxidase n=1 Tax=Porticoccus sp. W117 TaxID=3054777 RepID=UPI002596DC5E|nr:FAD-dependent oxidoreductase [Porticoccus sp. W117]MDM3871192.1 FAD-dependent oxidoreductase [Porticoccus sp. W117]
MKTPESLLPQNSLFDVAIIGGGIQGAGVAQAAAAAGYSVLLLERGDIGEGTSSKSSKLIHGGLRYLESGQVRLVWESLKERELLLKLAPDLVYRQHFHIPLYRSSKRKSWQLRLGLSLYYLLAGGGSDNRFRHNSSESLNNRFGELNQDDLTAIYRYSDAQTDDQALTQAVAYSAQQLGASLLCQAQLRKAQWHDGTYLIDAQVEGVNRRFKSRCLVNTAGPWVNLVASRIQPKPPAQDVELVQGTHLLYSTPISEHCYYLEAPQDGRVVFVLPWQGQTLVGTTETLYRGHPDDCQPLEEEVAYLKAVVTHYFPDNTQEPSAQFAGLRVLPKAEGSAFSRSREVQLVTKGNYLALYGGKLTGYRATAQRVIPHLERMVGLRNRVADTSELPLVPAESAFTSTP